MKRVILSLLVSECLSCLSFQHVGHGVECLGRKVEKKNEEQIDMNSNQVSSRGDLHSVICLKLKVTFQNSFTSGFCLMLLL